MNLRSTILIAFSMVVACGLCPTPLSAAKSDKVEFERLSIEIGDDQRVEYDLGTLLVPENRRREDSRKIGIGFARFHARQPSGLPPIFLLPGGPGSSLLVGIESAKIDRRRKSIESLIGPFPFCDFVVVDQRGFSKHGDRLRAKQRLPETPPEQVRRTADRVPDYQAFARRAVADLTDQGIDLSGYNIKECAHDVADLSRALGYEQIVLMGTSFGSQWSFAVMRLHPDIVARALLSGVEPLNHAYDQPSGVFAAVQRMWHAIDQDPRFADHLPDGGMAAAAEQVIGRLENDPPILKVTDKESGEVITVGRLGPDDFPWNSPTRILELYHGNTDRAIRSVAMSDRISRNRTVTLIGPLIDSSLGVTPERRHRLWTDPATRYLGRSNFAYYLASADIWPSPDVGDDFRTPVQCEIPVVFAQGDWDTSTPIENTLEIAPFFVNGRVIIAHRGGHGVLSPINRQLPKVWAEIDEFLRSGDLNGIPAQVTLQPSRTFDPPIVAAE